MNSTEDILIKPEYSLVPKESDKKEVLLMQGLPASGKSTLAKQMCKDDDTYIRLCRDDLREMIGSYNNFEHEPMIKEFNYALAEIIANHGYNLIIDGINFSQSTINHWKEFAIRKDMDFRIKFVYCNFRECIRRDKFRENSVGEEVIESIYKKYILGQFR